MATLVAGLQNSEQVADPNVVKAVVSSCVAGDASCARTDPTQYAIRTTHDETARAIYFSRSPIPYDRESGGIGRTDLYRRHIGIYAYRKDFLLEITALPPTPLEQIEKLEQLRALENGYPILVGTVEHIAEGIDTPEQYAAFVARQKDTS